MRCVLVGNYGAGNVGDEALKEYFLQAFPDIEWSVVSASARGKGETPRLPFGIRSLFHPWWRTLSAIKNADAVVFGGGTLFTDIESIAACRMWRRYAGAARLQNKPYFLAFQGVGPFKTPEAEAIACETFEGAAFVSVRDAASLARIQTWKLSHPPVLTSDPAIALFARHPRKTATERRLVLIPRTNSDDEFFGAVKQKIVGESWDSVRILLMQPDARERGVAERIRSITPSSSTVEILSVSQLLDEVDAAAEVVTQRYHGALAAMAMGKPATVVAQAEGDKLFALRRDAEHADESVKQRLELIKAGKTALDACFEKLRKHG